MVSRIPQCDSRRLALALANRLPAAESETVTRHLTSCPHCQAELERQAGDAAWWEGAKAFLSSADELVAIDAEGRPLALPPDDETADATEALDFLTPSSNPNMLGRLGGYEVERVIGRGGMGIVLLAHDTALQRRVAIKILAGHLALSAAARRRFAREAQAAAAVVHDHVIPIHSVDTSGSIPFLVMPHVAGRSLQERLDADGVLDVKEALRIALQTAQGLAAAHAQGLVHRDIKPANILLENGASRVRITDFGLARAIDDASQTQSGFIAGTPQYMSPEQARGEPIDARADLFSLGSVMYAMCSGHPPFRAETTLAVLRRICDDAPRDLREANPDVPVWMAAIVHRLLAKSPDERFQSAAEVAQLLEQWLAHLQQPTVIRPPAVLTAKPSKQREKRPFFWPVISVGGLLATVLIAVVAANVFMPPTAPVTAKQPPPNAGQATAVPWTPAAAPAELARSVEAGTVGPPPTPPGLPPDALQSELDSLARQLLVLEAQMPRGGAIAAATLAADAKLLEIEVQRLEEELRGVVGPANEKNDE